jgi:hypothetical protein
MAESWQAGDMMRYRLIVGALLLPTAAQAERFAIHCEGTATLRIFENGRASPERPPVPTQQIYVIDEEAQTVHRALMPRQEFENLCGTEGLCFRTFSPGLIRIEHEIDEPGSTLRADLTLDRQSGRADYRLVIAVGQIRSESHWQMTCERGEIPVFDTRRNRF